MRITPEDQRKLRERVKILGMHCASCAITIERELRKLPGIREVSVSLASNEAVIEYDPSRVTLRDIMKTVRGAGYDTYREEAVFLVKNLYSHDDDTLVENKLSKLPGVFNTRAFHVSKKIVVTFNPLTITTEKIRDEIEKLGYRVEKILVEEVEEDIEAKLLAEEQKDLKKSLILSLPLSIILGVYMFLWNMGYFVPLKVFHEVVGLLLSTPVLVYGGKRFFLGAYRAIRNFSANMDTLVALGAGSAYIYSLAVTLGVIAGEGVYYEATAFIISFILIGRYIEIRVKARTGEVVRKLARLQPEKVRVYRDGAEVEVSIRDVKVGDRVLVKEGERIPVDGVVDKGRGYVDESMITGESEPVFKEPRKPVIAGSLLVSGYLEVIATRVGRDTVLSQLIRLVRHAQSGKPRIQRIVDKVAGVFAWIVISIAVLVFMYWYFGRGLSLGEALIFTSSVLLIACPCALGLASPMAVVVGIGRVAENGILVRDIEAIEKIRKATTIVFDKTGTLTRGSPRVAEVVAVKNVSREEVVSIAASIEQKSKHPLAKAITEYARQLGVDLYSVENYDTLPGSGVVASIQGELCGVGNEKLVKGLEAELPGELKHISQRFRKGGYTVVYVVRNGRVIGIIALVDEPREGAREVISLLKLKGLRIAMLTGDKRETAETIAKRLGIDEVYAEVDPEEKVDRIRELRGRGEVVVMVGDGINDAPSLVEADVGIAMGGGTDIAREAGDIILMKNDLRGVIIVFEAANAIYRKILQNLFWAFVYNTALIPVAAGVLASRGIILRPEMAAIAMAMSSISVTLSALSLKRWKPKYT